VSEEAQFLARCGPQGMDAKGWNRFVVWNKANNGLLVVRDEGVIASLGVVWAVDHLEWDHSKPWHDQEAPENVSSGDILYIAMLAVDKALVRSLAVSKDIFNGIVAFGRARFPQTRRLAYHRIGDRVDVRGWEFANG